jgi:PDZ domain-containing protein
MLEGPAHVKTKRLTVGYKTGLILLLPIIIFGELLWVIDPLRLPGDLFLIDYIHILISLTSIVPFLWALSALLLWRSARTRKFYSVLIRSIVIASSIPAGLTILAAPKEYWTLGISLVLAFISVLADLISTEYTSQRSFPKRSVCWTAGAVIALTILLCPTPYLVTYPGMTMNMNRYAHVDEGEPQGHIAGVLIFERPAFPVDWLYARLFPNYSFSRMEDLGMSLGEYNQVVRVMKQDANSVAAAIGMERAGIGRGAIYLGVFVNSVMKGSPAEGILEPGDIIVQMNEQRVNRIEDLQLLMQAVKPGESIAVDVLRDGKPVLLRLDTMPSDVDSDRAVIGIQITDYTEFDVPLKVEFTEYLLHEGGPSHGAMLTLTIIDQLTPGGVTYGNQVAGTGTIRSDGSIGAIGGIRQKAFTVARSGADVFFVPSGQEEEARLGSAELTIVPVRTIDDILNWLKEHPKQVK